MYFICQKSAQFLLTAVLEAIQLPGLFPARCGSGALSGQISNGCFLHPDKGGKELNAYSQPVASSWPCFTLPTPG